MCAFTEMVDVDLLVPNPLNPNKHSDRQIEILSKIMNHQGWRHPITVSKRSGFICAGHGRLMAAKKLGWTSAPVDRQDFASEADEYAHLIADNKVQEMAEHDDSMMIDHLRSMPDFDLELLGIPDFVLPEIEVLPLGDPDAIPDHADTRVKRGDVWILGRHRLMCGDSTSIDDAEKLMAGDKAEMLFTDPPYGVSFVGLKGSMYIDGKKAGLNSSKEIIGDGLREEDLSQLFRDAISTGINLLIDRAALYIFFAINRSSETLSGLKDCNLDIRNWLIWDKGNVGFHAMGAQYNPNYEAFLYCHKRGHSPEWVGNPQQQTIWRHSSERLGLHPTMKPVALVEQAIGNHNPKIVLDLFGGSGSTLIACEKTGRTNFSMEIDQHYCDVILTRWENYTGKKAELISDAGLEENLNHLDLNLGQHQSNEVANV